MPRSPLSRLLALIGIVALGFLAAAPPPADASPQRRAAVGAGQCTHPSVADSTKAAMAVFTGTVTAVTPLAKPGGQRGALYNHMVTVTRVFQGKVASESVQVQTDRTPHECSLGQLAVGSTYMFMVTGDGSPWVAEGDGGTALADPALLTEVEALLGPGKDPVPPAPEHASFTPLHPSAPTRLSRAAAPGLALVLIGLLGLVVVRGLARRSR